MLRLLTEEYIKVVILIVLDEVIKKDAIEAFETWIIAFNFFTKEVDIEGMLEISFSLYCSTQVLDLS